jgi:hypothetical protein
LNGGRDLEFPGGDPERHVTRCKQVPRDAVMTPIEILDARKTDLLQNINLKYKPQKTFGNAPLQSHGGGEDGGPPGNQNRC